MAKLSAEDVLAAKVLVDRGRSIRSMARQLEVHESTLRYRLGRVGDGVEDGRRYQPEACAPYAEQIQGWMDEQADNERPAPVKELSDELVAYEGYTGSYKAVLR